jgi:hypothetical protein
MLYDNFDNATDDIVTSAGFGKDPQIHAGALSSYDAWVRDSSKANQVIARSSASPKAHSIYHARANFDSDLGNLWTLALHVPYSVGTGGKVYISYYYRFTKTNASWGRQTKSWIVYDSGFGPNRAYWNTPLGGCQDDPAWRVELLDSGVQDASYDGTGGQEIDGEWVRHETYLHLNAAGTANGTLVTVTNRPTIGTPEINRALDFNGSTDLRVSTNAWVEWVFGGAYYDDCTGVETATIDVDDFYMDDTLAHVEVCNSPTRAARTKCELQVPTAWSDTSITATFNVGYLSPGNPAYVYVINAGGGVNAQGYEITVAP